MLVHELDIETLGFINNKLKTKHHVVEYVFYDIGRLSITNNYSEGRDSIYLEDYFELNRFIEIIYLITGHRIQID